MDNIDNETSVPICYLLRIPGEIRNMIYEYVLTEESGLLYRRQGQVELLCRANTEPNPKTTFHQIFPACTPGNAGPAPANQLHCRAPPASANIPEDTGPAPANQLQFVNWQFRTETRALGIRYNPITFHGTAAAERFLTMRPLEQYEIMPRINIKVRRMQRLGFPLPWGDIVTTIEFLTVKTSGSLLEVLVEYFDVWGQPRGYKKFKWPLGKLCSIKWSQYLEVGGTFRYEGPKNKRV